jgi:hypothetical protein
MMIVRFDDARLFDLPGIRITDAHRPARRATETMIYRVELDGGQRVPDRGYDREEVSHLPPGPPMSE